MALPYSSRQLVNIGRKISSCTRISGLLWSELKALDIRKPVRGFRGGVHRQRSIATVVGNRSIWGPSQCGAGINVRTEANCCQVVNTGNGGVNLNNIVEVPYVSQIEPVTGMGNEGKVVNRGIVNDNLVNVKPQFDIRIGPIQSRFKLAVLNVHSARKKGDMIMDSIRDEKLDVLALTETWFVKDEDAASIASVTPDGYSIYHIPRTNKRGGGVAVIFRDTIKKKVNKIEGTASFEYLDISLSHDSELLRLLVIYRPPSNSVHEFCKDFAKVTDTLNVQKGNLVIVGDMNVHVDNPQNHNVAQFLDVLDTSNLVQHVDKPTHNQGHTLDLVLTRSSELIISDITYNHSVISDHAMVVCHVSIAKPCAPKKTITARDWKQVDLAALQTDIVQQLHFPDGADVEKMVTIYNTVLRNIVNDHAPAKTKTVTVRTNTPWFTSEIARAKRLRRKLERQWLKSGLTIHNEMFRNQRDLVNTLIQDSKAKFYSELITNVKDQKELFGLTNQFMHKTKCTKLPTHENSQELADKFINYFSTKIADIRTRIESQPTYDVPEYMPECTNHITEIPLATEDEVLKLIKDSKSKSCSLDPIPTFVLKQCALVLAPFIKTIINHSVSSGVMPPSLKRAIITPLIKKPNLDQEKLSNYRPVSNLPYVSKLIEKHVDIHLTRHDEVNCLNDPLQSAYTKGCSTETALVKVQSDLLNGIDQGWSVALILLDLSAAFDTIDHAILLQRLDYGFGIKDTALQWIRSYMSGRQQSVVIDGIMSESCPLITGVPQGSGFGPKGYKKYYRPVGIICERNKLDYTIFADDSQLYVFFKPGDTSSEIDAKNRLEMCIKEINEWMNANYLKLNGDKTELIFLQSKWHPIVTQELCSVTVGNNIVLPVESVRNLGVIFDSHLSMDAHVRNVCKRAFFEIRNISRIRKFLTSHAAKSLVHAFVTSKLDYCNALLFGISVKLQDKLQRVLNCAARVVARLQKFDHITPTLIELHWLPIAKRIEFKILLLTFKAIHGLAPSYIQDMVHIHTPVRNLRSANSCVLVRSKPRLATYGEHAFTFAAHKLWNALPDDIRSISEIDNFKRVVKTYLFRKAY